VRDTGRVRTPCNRKDPPAATSFFGSLSPCAAVRAFLAVALAALAIPGCLGPLGTAPADCPGPASGEMLHPPIWPATYNPGEPSDLVYLADLDGPVRLATAANDGNETYSQPEPTFGDGKPVPFEDLRFTSELGDRHFGAIRLDPAVAEEGVVLNFRFEERDPDCAAQGGLSTNWGARGLTGSRAAEAGQGAHVWYAGFWENGTLFDTNLQDLDVSAWPRAGWYEGGHWDPIPVYLYDQDRSEQPAHWKSAAGNVPARPTEADPADPYVDQAIAAATGAVDGTAGTGYFTTIKGFNEAVKGLPVGSRQVFRLAPEDAYTQPGREEHVLYGDALVFLVEVRDVVDVPCPAPPVADPGCSGLAGQVPPLRS
jgi:FKBP-type peptidyl-prolyl cis-trans isomerase 2